MENKVEAYGIQRQRSQPDMVKSIKHQSSSRLDRGNRDEYLQRGGSDLRRCWSSTCRGVSTGRVTGLASKLERRIKVGAETCHLKVCGLAQTQLGSQNTGRLPLTTSSTSFSRQERKTAASTILRSEQEGRVDPQSRIRRRQGLGWSAKLRN